MHPDQMMLCAYAAGGAPPGIALLVACHLTYCPACRQAVTEVETMLGSLLCDVEADTHTSEAEMLAMLDAPAPAAPVARASKQWALGPLPAPLGAVIRRDFNDLRWRNMLPGVAEHVIAEDESEKIALMRVKPGCGAPQHTHEGRELTLILTGAMRDGSRVYRKGDLADADHEDNHHPRVEPGEICHCLVVQTGKLRFTGTFGRVLNLFN